MAHLWSLAVEEHFYLFWPLIALLFVFKHPKKKQIVYLILAFIIVSICKIGFLHLKTPIIYHVFTLSGSFTFFEIHGIILGSLLAIILFQQPLEYKSITFLKNKSTIFILISLVLFIIILFKLWSGSSFYNNGGFILTDLLCVFTIFIAKIEPKHFLLTNKIMLWLGKRSYGIYIYHFPIFLFLENLRRPHSISNFVLVTILRFGISIIIAALSYKYVEQPILKLKKRYKPV